MRQLSPRSDTPHPSLIIIRIEWRGPNAEFIEVGHQGTLYVTDTCVSMASMVIWSRSLSFTDGKYVPSSVCT